MAFTTRAALKTAILDAITGHIAGTPFLFKYEFEGVSREYRSIKELQDLYDWLDNQDKRANRARPSFGRYRRFQ